VQQGMTLGRLLNLEIIDPRTGRVVKRRCANKWLVTTSSGKDLLICTAGRSVSHRLSGDIVARHRKFHRSNPRGAMLGEHPDPVGPLRQVGLLKALTYSVPGGKIKSPEKNPYHWHHKFGDTGHRGGDYPSRVYPAVYTDSRGNLYIKRRPGNIYKTTDWIRG
jgi:hypothetical protein